MSEPLYRSFVLRTPNVWTLITEFVKGNAQQAIDRDKPLHLFIVDDDMDRLEVQCAFYFGVVLKKISEEAWVDGKTYTVEEWHEHLAKDILGSKEVIDKKTQKPRTVRRSVARGQITVGEMARYTTQVQAWAANAFGITWD